jgi:hypothetical protein
MMDPGMTYHGMMGHGMMGMLCQGMMPPEMMQQMSCVIRQMADMQKLLSEALLEFGIDSEIEVFAVAVTRTP